jgi:thiol:disulfide interchange protein
VPISSRWLGCLLAALLLFTGRAPAAEVHTGDTEAQVLQELGAPKGRMKQKGVETFFYDGGTVQLQDGKVIALDGQMAARARQRAEQASFEKEQADRGLVNYDGEWVSKAEAARREAAKVAASQPAASQPAATPPANRLRMIRKNGARIELSELLAPNQITVVDFFADWCGPCRAISPHLATLVSQDPDVVVCQVDMVKWDSPVARQYDLHSVPNLRVYDRSGRMIGQPTSNFRAVLDAVTRAKRAR